ncbi:DNA translocase FtsK [Ferrimicrobium sp.]|uniref:DNA translocase FtsK n=1 Tax=Ferrimicrobium sp. TaxID=2926050 RepID=UPI00261DFE77|nr:DNA translocase FtsK [Ferrimicrobium sp.]
MHWSREATGLVWMVGAVLLGLIAYSGLFGGLGRVLLGLSHDLFGVLAWVLYLVAAVIGFAVLMRYQRLPRHALIVAGVLVAAVAAIDAAVELGTKGHLVLPGARFGGVVGDLIGFGATTVAGSIGGTIVLVLIGALCLLGLLGLRPRESMDWLVTQVSGSREQSLATARQRHTEEEPPARPERKERRRRSRGSGTAEDGLALGGADPSETAEAVEPSPIPTETPIPIEEPMLSEALVPPVREDGPWRLPPQSLLKRGSRAKIDRADLERRGRVLESALGSHGVTVKVVNMTVGPTVTRYELELAEGVKVARVLALQRDIAYAMAATDVRILAPIPGKSAIGVEVPNRVREVVTLGDVLASPQMERASKVLEVPLGRDISGTAAVFDIAAMPHVLVAGSTGSGKSSLINSLLTSLLVRNTPRELRLILVDPKRVELSQYNALPHLLTSVVVDPKKAAHALNWAVDEMERRYDILAHWGVRDIVGYRELIALSGGADDPDEGPPEELPYILVVIDELNDLMMAAPRDVEDSICRIAQKARAVGVHLVIATQRPSVDVITGVIKTNVPSRIAFAVASQTDSRVILDQLGAEKLVGKGDLLMVTATSSQPRRLQAPWVSEHEVAAVVGHWRRQGTPAYLEELDKVEDNAKPKSDLAAEVDPLFATAARLIVETGAGSTSMLQRRLKVGFARAGRLMDLLEDRGIVGPADGSKQRQVLVTPEELEELDI